MITAKEARIISESITSAKVQADLKIINEQIQTAANAGLKHIAIKDIYPTESIKLYLESLGYKCEIVSSSYQTPLFLRVDW